MRILDQIMQASGVRTAPIPCPGLPAFFDRMPGAVPPAAVVCGRLTYELIHRRGGHPVLLLGWSLALGRMRTGRTEEAQLAARRNLVVEHVFLRIGLFRQNQQRLGIER